jgi:hypothetical protein
MQTRTRSDTAQPTLSGPCIHRADSEPAVCFPPGPTCGASRPVLVDAAVSATGPPAVTVPDLFLRALL